MYRSLDVPRSTGGRPATMPRVPAPPACAPRRYPQTPARPYNGKRLGAHVISESESVTHFPAIQVYVSARSSGCATARSGTARGAAHWPSCARCHTRAGLPQTSLCLRSHSKCRAETYYTSQLLCRHDQPLQSLYHQRGYSSRGLKKYL